MTELDNKRKFAEQFNKLLLRQEFELQEENIIKIVLHISSGIF